MKLNFEVSKNTNVEHHELKEKIFLWAKNNGYLLAKNEDLVISFEDDLRDKIFVSRTRHLARIEKGKFEIVVFDNHIIQKLKYSINILPEIIISVFGIIGGLFTDSFFFLVPIMFGLQLLFKMACLKNDAQNIMDEITRITNL
jgi:hypothetical protein